MSEYIHIFIFTVANLFFLASLNMNTRDVYFLIGIDTYNKLNNKIIRIDSAQNIHDVIRTFSDCFPNILITYCEYQTFQFINDNDSDIAKTVKLLRTICETYHHYAQYDTTMHNKSKGESCKSEWYKFNVQERSNICTLHDLLFALHKESNKISPVAILNTLYNDAEIVYDLNQIKCHNENIIPMNSSSIVFSYNENQAVNKSTRKRKSKSTNKQTIKEDNNCIPEFEIINYYGNEFDILIPEPNDLYDITDDICFKKK